MMSTTARTQCRIRIGERCLDGALPGSRSTSFLVALVTALALLVALLSLNSLVGERLGQITTAKPIAATMVQLSTPRVPTRPVEALERFDLSAVVSNTDDRAIANVALELTVLQPDGTTAMLLRQSHINLQPHDSRAIYWAWRVPAQLPTGEYTVQVRAFDASGRPLNGDQPATAALHIVGRGN